MKKEIKWSIAAVLLLCMGVVVYFLFLSLLRCHIRPFFLAEGLASQTECHIMDSGKEGPTIFLLAGTHGNEPAGFKGAEQLLERLEPKTGRIILVPHANQQAIELNQRTASDGVDMNRSYPGAEDGNPIQVLSAQIMELIGSLQKELDTAVILVTHDLGVVASVADYIQVMHAGKIVERGYGGRNFLPLYSSIYKGAFEFCSENSYE